MFVEWLVAEAAPNGKKSTDEILVVPHVFPLPFLASASSAGSKAFVFQRRGME